MKVVLVVEATAAATAAAVGTVQRVHTRSMGLAAYSIQLLLLLLLLRHGRLL